LRERLSEEGEARGGKRRGDAPSERVAALVLDAGRHEPVARAERATLARVVRVELEEASGARVGELGVVRLEARGELLVRLDALGREGRPLVRVGCAQGGGGELVQRLERGNEKEPTHCRSGAGP